MNEKVKIELGSVQETLLLPLWGRAVETQKARPILVDPKAVEVVAGVDYDFSRHARNISHLSQMAWIARSLFFDDEIRAYLQANPEGPVINLGCGLDTTFERVDNGRVRWFDLDLPDVIELRSRFIQESERRRFIAASALDRSWHAQISPRRNCMFLAGGFVYFFSDVTIRELFTALLAGFPGFEMIFDYSTPRGVRIANRQVMQQGGMSTALQWGVSSAKILETWDSRIRVVTDLPMFARFKKYLGLMDQVGATLSDLVKIMSLAHIKSID